MLAVWGYIESDFRRDYGICLREELPHMSWREFKILLDGLTPYGAVACHYEEELKKQRQEEERKSTTAPVAVTSFWNSIASIRG